MDDKSRIRSEFLQRRKSLASDVAHAKSASIIARLVHLPSFVEAKTLLVYVASKDNEVDTKPLIVKALADGKTVVVPCCSPERTLTWSSLRAWEELSPGPFGVLEPQREIWRPVIPPQDAPVIVPGIAFSPSGHRIGYGKGYYDRFLARHGGTSIGLAYDCQICPDLTPSDHDIPVDTLITESTVYDCGS